MGGLTPECIRPAAEGKSALWHLEQVGSTNAWAKEHMAQLNDLDVVYTTDQTQGRGRLGRTWENAKDQGLYYSIVIRRPLVQPAAIPLLASVAAARVLKARWGVDCLIKWPNDLLLNNKKLSGILCEGVAEGYVCGIGINLAQTKEFFAAADLPYGGSILTETGVCPTAQDARQLAVALTDEGFAPLMDEFARQGFGAIRQEYTAACVNLGRPVQFDGGQGVACDIDADGCLVVECSTGRTAVFTGEVSVQGIYGHL